MADQDDFSKAFDEATGLITGEEQKKTAEDEKKEASTEQQAVEADSSQAKQAEDDKAKEEPPVTGKESGKDLQRLKSLEGMYNSEVKRRAKTEEENAELKRKLEELEKAQKAPITSDDTTQPPKDITENPKIKSFKEEFPDVAEGVIEVMGEQVEKVKAEVKAEILAVKSQVEPVIQREDKNAYELHFKTINDAHADFDEIVSSGGLKAWIAELPAYKQEAYAKVYQGGSAVEVIDMVNDFKRAKGIENKSDEDENLKDLDISVKTKRSPVSLKTKRGAETYEAAFEEAIRS